MNPLKIIKGGNTLLTIVGNVIITVQSILSSNLTEYPTRLTPVGPKVLSDVS